VSLAELTMSCGMSLAESTLNDCVCLANSALNGGMFQADYGFEWVRSPICKVHPAQTWLDSQPGYGFMRCGF